MIANKICLLQSFFVVQCYYRYLLRKVHLHRMYECIYVFIKSSYLLGILRGASAVSIVGGLLDVQVGIVDDSCLGRLRARYMRFVTVVIAGNQ